MTAEEQYRKAINQWRGEFHGDATKIAAYLGQCAILSSELSQAGIWNQESLSEEARYRARCAATFAREVLEQEEKA